MPVNDRARAVRLGFPHDHHGGFVLFAWPHLRRIPIAILPWLAMSSEGLAQEPRLVDFTLDTIAPGVFVASASRVDHFFVEPNITYIVGDESVLVVDAGFLPSTAERLVELVRSTTNLPVSHLVNTHWHGDHLYGNPAWRDAFPDLEFVASEDGEREIIAEGVPDLQNFLTGSYFERLGTLRTEIRRKRTEDGTELGDDEIAERRRQLRNFERAFGEMRELQVIGPDLTFTDSLRLNLGGREVLLLHLGSGNTAGDAMAYLPEEEILITGDVVVHPRPYPSSHDFRSWIRVLESIQAMDVDVLVPGHGDVMSDASYAGEVASLYRVLLELMGEARARGLDQEEARESVTIEQVEDRLARDHGLERGHFRLSDGWMDWAVRQVFEAEESAASG